MKAVSDCEKPLSKAELMSIAIEDVAWWVVHMLGQVSQKRLYG